MLYSLLSQSWSYVIKIYGFAYFLANYINPVLLSIFMIIGIIYFVRHIR